jgi:hypothetical protein
MKERPSVGIAAAGIPWWLVAIGGLGLAGCVAAFSSPDYRVIFAAVAQGLSVTITVSLVAFAAARIFSGTR